MTIFPVRAVPGLSALPGLGLGVMFIPPADTIDIVHRAVALGYRSFDTAPVYGNEGAVGEAIRTAPLPREQLLITTKLWNGFHGYSSSLRAFDDTIARTGLDHVDLYLIHWPVPQRGLYVDSWRALVRLKAEGRVRAIGVCNFAPYHLRRIVDATGEVPAVNQIECHPGWQQRAILPVHAGLGILTQAWSPLGRGTALGLAPISAIAARHGRSPAQILLRWHVENGVMPVAKASSAAHLADNAAIFDFTLDEDDRRAIGALDRPDGRTGPDPETFTDIPRAYALG